MQVVSMNRTVQANDRVYISAYKADGKLYRSWESIVEVATPECIVTINPVGHRIRGIEKDWFSTYAIRSYFWLGKPYYLLEVYTPKGDLHSLYININSPVQVDYPDLCYTDYELDVVWLPPGPATVVDEDEFAAAALEYGYSAEHKRSCYQAAAEALELANHWCSRGMPAFNGQLSLQA